MIVPNTPRRRVARGVTLAELIIGVTVLAMLMGAMMSAVLIASHALPREGSGPRAAIAAQRAVSRMADELTCATTILEATERSVTFKVPDRTGNGQSDEIRYAWSGQKGDPLLRTVNGGAAETATPAVSAFKLTGYGRSADDDGNDGGSDGLIGGLLGSLLDGGGEQPTFTLHAVSISLRLTGNSEPIEARVVLLNAPTLE